MFSWVVAFLIICVCMLLNLNASCGEQKCFPSRSQWSNDCYRKVEQDNNYMNMVTSCYSSVQAVSLSTPQIPLSFVVEINHALATWESNDRKSLGRQLFGNFSGRWLQWEHFAVIKRRKHLLCYENRFHFVQMFVVIRHYALKMISLFWIANYLS